MGSLISSKVTRIEPSPTTDLENKLQELHKKGVEVLSLGPGEPDFDTPFNIKKAAWEALKEGKTNYQPTAGDYELRELISKKFSERNNIKVSAEEILVTPGAKFAIYLVLHAILEEGDQVLLLDPSWVSFGPAAKLTGANVIRASSNSKEDFQPDIDQINDLFSDRVKLVVINSPSNPTGAVYKRDIIKKVTSVAKRHNALVLSDELYEEIIFEGEHYSPGSDYNNVITVNGFSKSYAMTGWRLGYVTAPQAILESMKKIYQHSATCVNAFSQAGAVEALASEESDKALRSMVSKYKERRDLVMDIIKNSTYFSSTTPRGAFYCFPSYSVDKTSAKLAGELLEEIKVATVPGSAFGKCGEGHLRISFAASQNTIQKAFERIENYLSKNY